MNIDWKFYFSIFVRRLPYFLIVTVLITVLGTSVAVILPSQYYTQTLLLVEGPQIPRDIAESTVRTGAGEELQIIEQQIQSRTNLLDLANRYGLYRDQPGMAPGAILDDMRGRITFSGRSSKGQATTLTIGFFAADPDQALQVTEALVTQTLEKNVEMRTGRATDTLEFFRQDVERLGAELDRQGSAILAFRNENQNELADSLDFRRNRQASLQERLVQQQREEAAQKERRLRLVDLYERTGKIETTNNGGKEKSSPERQLADLQSQLSNALLIYSEQNPKVKFLQTRIAALENLVAERAVAGIEDEEGNALSPYEVQLAEIDGELAYIADQRTKIEAEIDKLQDSIEETPVKAAQLTEMQRERDITQGQYRAAVTRLAEAQTGQRIEVLSKGQRITVVEQAVRPTSPSSPKRKLIAGGSLMAGLTLGLAIVVLMEVLNRSVRRPIEITTRLGITPIATLPFVRTRYEMRRRRAVLAAAFFLAIFGVSGGLYALHTYYLPMDILVARVIDKVGLSPIFDGLAQRISG